MKKSLNPEVPILGKDFALTLNVKLVHLQPEVVLPLHVMLRVSW